MRSVGLSLHILLYFCEINYHRELSNSNIETETRTGRQLCVKLLCYSFIVNKFISYSFNLFRICKCAYIFETLTLFYKVPFPPKSMRQMSIIRESMVF